MDRSVIHEKIAEITELININNNRLFLHDEKIAQIEIDVLRKNAIELYEQINLLHITNLKSKAAYTLTDAQHDLIALKEDVSEPETQLQQTTPREIELIIETKKEDKNEGKEITSIEPPKEVIPEISASPVVESQPEAETELENSSPEIEEMIPEPENIVIEEPVDIPTSDKALNKNTEENTVKEKPSSQPSDIQPELFELKTTAEPTSKKKSAEPAVDIKNIFEKYRTSKIDSIKKAISILKKYEFQNQLFGNDPKVYNQSIEMLDQAASAEVAISLLENSWPEQYHWTEKEEKLVEELKELVYRRFS